MLKRVQVYVPFLSRSHNHYFIREVRPNAEVSNLIPRLRVKINPEHRKLRQPEGPVGRLNMLRQTVTALFKYERIEATYNRVHEAQGYAERIIAEAIRHGDCHTTTMEIADFWLLEKQLIHKLFKVLVPRFESSTRSYTRLYNAPRPYFGDGFYKPREDQYIDQEFAWKVHRPRAVIELRGNPYPPLLIPQVSNSRCLHNVLLSAAREEKRKLQVEKTLREEGLLGKSKHLHRVLAKFPALSHERDILGEEQDQLRENIGEQTSVHASAGGSVDAVAKANAEDTDVKSELSGQDSNKKSLKENKNVQEVKKSDRETKQSSEPSVT